MGAVGDDLKIHINNIQIRQSHIAYLLNRVKRQETFLLIVLNHLNDEREEVVQVPNSDVSCGKGGSGANFLLLCCESLNSLVEDLLLG